MALAAKHSLVVKQRCILSSRKVLGKMLVSFLAVRWGTQLWRCLSLTENWRKEVIIFTLRYSKGPSVFLIIIQQWVTIGDSSLMPNIGFSAWLDVVIPTEMIWSISLTNIRLIWHKAQRLVYCNLSSCEF